MIKVTFKEPTMVKSSSGLNFVVEAKKEVDVEEEFLKTVDPTKYEKISGKKKIEKDIDISEKETKEITTKNKNTK